MSKVYTDPQNYTDIASAIRYKNGTATQYKPQNMAAAIRAIVTDPTIQAITITQNGIYTAPSGVDGYSPITVNVSSGGTTIAFIAVSFLQGYECSCSNGSTTISGGTSGNCVFAIPNMGTWTISASVWTKDVIINTYGQREEVALCTRDELVISDTRKILTAGGRDYYKTNEGDAIVCFFYTGYTGPLLVSKNQQSVTYTTYGSNFESIGSITYDGETWYYSNNNYFMGGESVSFADPNVKLNTITGVPYYSSMSNAAKDLLDYYYRVI